MAFKALVVDDDNVVRKLHQMILKSLLIDVVVAENGKEAIDLIEAGAFFNLILIDMEMPIMNGKEATKRLREMGVTSTIVGVTSNEEAYHDAFMEAGANLCVNKPLKREVIADLLPTISPPTRPSPSTIQTN